MPQGHDTTIEVSNIMSFALYTQILKQSVLKPASPGITLRTNEEHENIHLLTKLPDISIFWFKFHIKCII